MHAITNQFSNLYTINMCEALVFVFEAVFVAMEICPSSHSVCVSSFEFFPCSFFLSFSRLFGNWQRACQPVASSRPISNYWVKTFFFLFFFSLFLSVLLLSLNYSSWRNSTWALSLNVAFLLLCNLNTDYLTLPLMIIAVLFWDIGSQVAPNCWCKFLSRASFGIECLEDSLIKLLPAAPFA